MLAQLVHGQLQIIVAFVRSGGVASFEEVGALASDDERCLDVCDLAGVLGGGLVA
jgi:hypothetical protein